MLRIAQVRGNLQSSGIAIGIVAASGVLMVAAALVMFSGIGRDDGAEPQVGIVVFDVTVPQEIPLSEYSSGLLENGDPLELSGITVSLQFQGGYLEAIDLPVFSTSGHLLASFSDTGAGIHLEQDGMGQATLRFPLLSNQGGIPVTITVAVEAIQPQDQGSKMRISLGRMEAEARFSVIHTPDSGLPSIEQVRLAFELHRLPRDARLTLSRVEELDQSTRSMIDSSLEAGLGPWTLALAVEARTTDLVNGDDVGEAALYLTISDLGLGSVESLVTVHVDDEGRAERLESEVVSSLDNEFVIRFLSPRGLSIFAVMVPDDALIVTPTPAPTPTAPAISTLTATPSASPSPTPSPTSAATATSVPTSTPVPTSSPTALPRPTPTPLPTPDATVPATPTATATSLPAPTPTPFPTPTRSPSPTATATLVPTEVPTPTSSPRPTRTPRPTPTRTTRPPTSTPIPVPDEHYAVIVHTRDLVRQQWLLDTLGTKWFLDWSDNMDAIPEGHEKLIFIGDLPGPSPQKIQDIADLAPGSVWYVVGEPNRRNGYGASDIVAQLHDLYEEIKAADPTAKITSPSVLNWEFTCNGCGGFQTGLSWVEEFRTTYMEQYGVEPPVDIWAIDVYPLDWFNLPTVDHQLAIDQVNGLRQYLDATGLQGVPIWITELGLHWGYDALVWDIENCTIDGVPIPSPAGTYRTEQVIGYLGAVFDWLEANAGSKNIEKWFLLSTYENINTCNSSAYAGLTLFDAPDAGASLTEVGQFFADRVMGID